jgi:hypothetical protein
MLPEILVPVGYLMSWFVMTNAFQGLVSSVSSLRVLWDFGLLFG